MKIQKLILFLIFAVLAFIPACEPNRRYAVLSFFFDGVPKPGTEDQGQKTRDTGESKSEQEKRSFYQHGPYAARICDGCHQPGTNKLILPKEELCTFCHTLSVQKRVHGPLAAGGCTICHDPHGTTNRALLVADARDFCLFCHDPRDIMKRPVHRDSSGTCTVCHDAHGADNEYLLKNRLVSRINGSTGRSL